MTHVTRGDKGRRGSCGESPGSGGVSRAGGVRDNGVVNKPVTELADSYDFRLAPAARVRMMGAGLIAIGLVLVVATLVIAIANLSAVILSVLVVIVVVSVFALGYVLNRRSRVLHLDRTGYRVGVVRGAGTGSARWTDVLDLQTSTVAGARCMVIRLRNGGTTTIPVDVVEGDSEELVRTVAGFLDRAH